MSYFIKCPKNTVLSRFALLMKTTAGTFVTYVSKENIQEGRITDPKISSATWWDFKGLNHHIDESLVPVKVLE